MTYPTLDWHSHVATRWPVLPLKRLFRIVNGATPASGEEAFWDGDIPWATPEDLGKLAGAVLSSTTRMITEEGYRNCGTTLMPAGSIVLSTRAPIGHAALAAVPLCTNQGCKGLVPRRLLDSRFFYYVVVAAKTELQSRGKGTTFTELSFDALASFPVPAPNVEEQCAIADFLDRETARIDDLTRMQASLDKLLVESRRSIVANTVCRGTDPNATVTESGVGWLGAIPSGWHLSPVKRLFHLIVDPAPDAHGMELLSLYTDIGVRPRKELDERGNKASTTDGYFIVRRGDFIFNKLLAWMGAIGLSGYDGVTSPAYDILRPIVPMVARYYDYLFRCGICLPEFRRHSRGIMDMRLRLYFDKLGPLLMPYPPIEEQIRIVEFLDRETLKIDEIRSCVSRCVERLGEYRSALIAAAVTGQIDVRTYRPQEAAAVCP